MPRIRDPRFALMLVPAAMLGATQHALAADPVKLHLLFSDGTEHVAFGSRDDATRNISAVGDVPEYPPFYWPTVTSGRFERQAVVQTVLTALHKIFLPYNILVGTARPAEGPYNTVFIGGTPDIFMLDQRVAGVAVMDCFNSVASNVVYAFPNVVMGNIHGLITTVAQEAAHSFGLEHTEDPEDLMHPTVNSAQRAFVDRDSLIVPPRLCGPRVQNSHQAMLQALGPWTGGRKPLLDGTFPDIEPPVVTVLTPLPDTTIDLPVRIYATVQDESAVSEVFALFFGQKLPMAGPPYQLTLPASQPGPLLVSVVAVDAMGNQGQSSVTFFGAPEGGCAVADRRSASSGGWVWLLLLALGLVWRLPSKRTCPRGATRL